MAKVKPMSRIFATSAVLSIAAIALAEQPPVTNRAAEIPVKDADSSNSRQPEAIAPKNLSVSYMGVATAILQPALREHLDVSPGVGLIVDHVDPGSPAEAAGVKQNDILLRLNDQILISVYQLTVLVRTHKPGEPITLSLIRQGKPLSLPLKLGQKELPALEYPSALMVPQDMPDTPFPRVGEGRVSRVVTHVDDEHFISITTHDDRKQITVKDLVGKVVYEGELNTVEDHRKIPDGLREKVDRVEQGVDRMRELRSKPRAQPDRGGNGSM